MSNYEPTNSTFNKASFLRKRNSSVPSSMRIKTTNNSSLSKLVPPKKCAFCVKNTSFPRMVTKALYSKYSSSQNYYYTKDVNEILSNAKSSKVILFKDFQHYDEEEEYFKRFYKYSEYDTKIKMLTEYYKYHNDIARMFMKPITDVTNRYHDKKRKLEYLRVTKMLKEQNKAHNTSIRQESRKLEQPKYIPLTDRVLADLETPKVGERLETQGKDGRESARVFSRSPSINSPEKEKKSKKIGANYEEKRNNEEINKGNPKLSLKTEDHPKNEFREISNSNTIHELNLKLGEIISNSHSRTVNLDAHSYFEMSYQPNDSFSNLNNFINFIKASNPANQLNLFPDIININEKRGQSPRLRIDAPQRLKFEVKAYREKREKNDLGYGPGTEFKTDMFNEKNKDHGEPLPGNVSNTDHCDLPRKKSRKIDFNEDYEKSPSPERLTLDKLPTPSLKAAIMNRTRNISTPNTRIKNFEEAFRTKQLNKKFKINSQRSSSRERNQQRPSLNSSNRNIDEKIMQNEERSREITGVRRSNQLSYEELSKSGVKGAGKDYSKQNIKNIQNILESNPEMLNLNQNILPALQKEMRISLDTNSVGKLAMQQASSNNSSNITGTAKAISLASQTKIHSGASSNGGFKIISHKAIANNIIPQTNKEIRNLISSGQIDLGLGQSITVTKNEGTRPTLTTRERSGSQNRSLVPENTIVSIKNNTERFYGKTLTQRESRNPAQHKFTKSEEKLTKLEAAFKRKSPTQTQEIKTHRIHDPSKNEVRLFPQEEHSGSRQIITYNNNNVVNIFVNPQNDHIHDNLSHISKKEPKMSSNSNDLAGNKSIKISSQKLSSAEELIKFPQSQIRKASPVASEIRRTGASESPLRIIRKDDLRLSKSKSGSTATGNTPLKLREKYL